MWYTYIIIAIILLVAELVYFRIADKCNIIDKPNERSSHSKRSGDGSLIRFVVRDKSHYSDICRDQAAWGCGWSIKWRINGELNAPQKATLQFIIEHEGCTASEISEMTKIPFSTIDKHVRVLLKVGLIERRGSKKTGGYYSVTKK